MAARWAEKNPNVKGPALETAMQKEPWDPSVKGLTSVPQVLAMMNEKLDWTAQLGEAFLAQPNDVQTAVQTLRKQAETTGNLKSGKEQKVSRSPRRKVRAMRDRPNTSSSSRSSRTTFMCRSTILSSFTAPAIGDRLIRRSSGARAGGWRVP